jgi:hypothetical protein
MAKCKNCKNIYNLSDENDVIVGKWCPKISDSPNIERDRECRFYVAQTNADKIRSMSDEELMPIIMCPNDIGMANIQCKTYDIHKCNKCVLDWLKSEVEG